MLGQRHNDFLICEEPLDGDVEFFASSADASPSAAADATTETTPDPEARAVHAGRHGMGGSAVTLPRLPAPSRLVIAGLLLAACAALAAVVDLSASKATPRAPHLMTERPGTDGRPASPTSGPAAVRQSPGTSSRVVGETERAELAHETAAHHRRRPARPAEWTNRPPVHRTGGQARPAGRDIGPQIGALPQTESTPPQPSLAPAAPTQAASPAAPTAASRSEFEFER